MSDKDSHYVITQGKGGDTCITCLTCGHSSYNRHDIEQLYCGNCHRFHTQKMYTQPEEKEVLSFRQLVRWMRMAQQRFYANRDASKKQTLLRRAKVLERLVDQLLNQDGAGQAKSQNQLPLF